MLVTGLFFVIGSQHTLWSHNKPFGRIIISAHHMGVQLQDGTTLVIVFL